MPAIAAIEEPLVLSSGICEQIVRDPHFHAGAKTPDDLVHLRRKQQAAFRTRLAATVSGRVEQFLASACEQEDAHPEMLVQVRRAGGVGQTCALAAVGGAEQDLGVVCRFAGPVQRGDPVARDWAGENQPAIGEEEPHIGPLVG